MELKEIEAEEPLSVIASADELEAGLDALDHAQTLTVEIDQSLETALHEMSALKAEYSREEADELIDLCKQNVLSTIVGQFGIASLFLEVKDGGNVTTTHNFEKGIVATEADAKAYQDLQDVRHGGFKERRPLYDKRKNEVRQEVKDSGAKVVKDAYTGESISIKRADVDHVVSSKEWETNAAAHLFLNQEERVKAGTDDSNLSFTKDKANRSKGSKKMEDWLDKKDKEGRTNAERHGIDRKLALARDKEARKKLSRTVNKAAFKKYSTELLATGGKDAARTMAYSAIGVIMHDLSVAVIEELKYALKNHGNQSFKALFRHFKSRMSEVLSRLKEKWKGILAGSLEAGIMSFLSNMLVFVINLFATTLKKLVGMIRAGFVSLCEATKMMFHPPAGMTQDEANFAAAKLLTAGIIGAFSIGLSATIEKFLQAIPGLQPIMMFPIPSLGAEQRTVSDVLSVTLSALAGGLATTIVIYYMDKFASAGKRDRVQMQLVTTSGVVVQCQVAKTWLAMGSAYDFLAEEAIHAKEAELQVEETIKSSNAEVVEGLRGWDAIKKRIGK